MPRSLIRAWATRTLSWLEEILVSAVTNSPPELIIRPVPRDQRPDLDILPQHVSAMSERARIFDLVLQVRKRDLLTYEHSRRVAIYARRLARALGCDREDVQRFGLAGMLHDAGKTWILDDILNKKGPLDGDQYHDIRRHAEIGANLITAFDLPDFFRDAALSHHEAYDGSGYPKKLAGEAIPYVARVLTVADVFDVITSDRPYSAAQTATEALEDMESKAGAQFDPRIVTTFAGLIRRQKDMQTFIVPARICPVRTSDLERMRLVTDF
jgi:putative nucleotidyltransferase with HDIG domain